GRRDPWADDPHPGTATGAAGGSAPGAAAAPPAGQRQRHVGGAGGREPHARDRDRRRYPARQRGRQLRPSGDDGSGGAPVRIRPDVPVIARSFGQVVVAFGLALTLLAGAPVRTHAQVPGPPVQLDFQDLDLAYVLSAL